MKAFRIEYVEFQYMQDEMGASTEKYTKYSNIEAESLEDALTQLLEDVNENRTSWVEGINEIQEFESFPNVRMTNDGLEIDLKDDLSSEEELDRLAEITEIVESSGGIEEAQTKVDERFDKDE